MATRVFATRSALVDQPDGPRFVRHSTDGVHDEVGDSLDDGFVVFVDHIDHRVAFRHALQPPAVQKVDSFFFVDFEDEVHEFDADGLAKERADVFGHHVGHLGEDFFEQVAGHGGGRAPLAHLGQGAVLLVVVQLGVLVLPRVVHLLDCYQRLAPVHQVLVVRVFQRVHELQQDPVLDLQVCEDERLFGQQRVPSSLSVKYSTIIDACEAVLGSL